VPRIAILIPSYNHGRFLEACIRSIQAQTFADWEVVLVDDGSKDDSVEMARRLAADEPRLKVFVNEVNLGTYGTEQRALELSESEFVAVMNSDDLWAPEKLSKQVALMERHPESFACFVLGKMVDDAGEVIADEDVHADWPREEVQDTLPYLLFENRILASGVLFRRDGLKFETTLRYSGDWVALLQAAERGPLAWVAEDLVFWRQHDNNTYRRSERQMIEEIRVRRAIWNARSKWLAHGRDRSLIRRGLEKNQINLASLLLYFLDAASLRNCVWQAVLSGLYHPALVKRSLASLVSVRKARAVVWRLESVLPESTADAQRAIREQIPLVL
jgi:glycosyltransferase involved in cell wall biosynthesis